MRTNAIKTYLEPDLAREVTRLARAFGRSESSIIAEAVRTRVTGNADQASSAARETQRRQLNRIELRLDKLLHDHALMKECLLLFVRVWLEYNPPMNDSEAQAAAASATARFDRFLDLLMKGLTPGQSIAASALNGADDITNGAAHEAGASA